MEPMTIAHYVSINGNEEYIVLLDDDEEAEGYYKKGEYKLAGTYEVEIGPHSLPMGYVLNRE